MNLKGECLALKSIIPAKSIIPVALRCFAGSPNDSLCPNKSSYNFLTLLAIPKYHAGITKGLQAMLVTLELDPSANIHAAKAKGTS